jgi:preprotein translocase subunit SecD
VTVVQAAGRVAALSVAAVVAATLPATIVVDTAQATSPAKHTLEFRPVLAALPVAGARTPTADETAAIASCDPGRLQALSGVPLTPRTALTGDACAVLSFAPHDGEGALYVGPARLTATDVASARSTFQSGQGYSIVMSLTKAGKKKFNGMAHDLFARESPGNEVAVVTDGRVVSNPAFQTDEFSGPVQISGNFTGKQARNLAATINRARRGT